MGTQTINFGGNVNFSGASGIALGANAVIKNSYYTLRLGDQNLTEQQVKNIIRGTFDVSVIQNTVEQHILIQEIKNLPRAEAEYNDYQSQKQSETCFEGTRVVILEELARWVINRDSPQLYALSGPAGIGKSTIAYTFAARAAKLGILGASFFFSRDEPDRRTAKKLFTSMAYQLCVHNKTFAHAIGQVLLTERGTVAVTKDPQEQMQTLILEQLRGTVESRRQPTVIVIDAIDECDAPDCYKVLASLERLVQGLPSFKVLITSRPQPRIDRLLSLHKRFSLQNIGEQIINSDIQHYLKYNLSSKNVDECLPDLRDAWSANDDEIEHLVRMAGGLFIIASTAIRLLLDTTIYNPARQMVKLKADSSATLGSLERFYTIIIRGAVPEHCGSDIVQRFKAVVGAVLTVQEPLPIEALKDLTDLSPSDIDAVLKNLKSVIMIDEDIPRIYHKSFSDFLTNEHHAPPEFHIILKDQNTRIAINCFRLMNMDLKQNILDLGELARFMDNEEGLQEQKISVHDNIPLQLQYACMYWANHTGEADLDDNTLKEELNRFAKGHLLHWLECLSWIHQLSLAHRALRILIPHLESRLPDINQLFSDTLRFISKFYEIIEQSALHIYYSALPFTPTETLLYRTYHKQETAHNKCRVEGGSKQWDTLLASFQHGSRVERVSFSQDSSKLISWSKHDQNLRLWDATAGIPLGTIMGDIVAVADSFAVTAHSKEYAVFLYDLDSFECTTTLKTPALVIQLAVSIDGSRIAAGLSNDTVDLWDGKTREWINNSPGHEPYILAFSPTGSRLAINSYNNRIALQDGAVGKHIAHLDYRSEKLETMAFSHDGCVLACLARVDFQVTLTLWNTHNGKAIGFSRGVGNVLAVSADGSLVATATKLGNGVRLWTTGSSDKLLKPLQIFGEWVAIDSLSFSNNDMLAIASWQGMAIYNVKSQSVVATLPYDDLVRTVEFSSDCSRLAAGGRRGILALWDVHDIGISRTEGSEDPVQMTPTIGALAFSSYCSQLGPGFEKSMAMWDMTNILRPVAPPQSHYKLITAVAFTLNVKQNASGSRDGTVRFWNDDHRTSIRAPSWVHSMAFSGNALAAASNENITLWDLKTSNLICTLDEGGSRLVTFSHHGFLLASFNPSGYYLSVWDIEKRIIVAKFVVPVLIGAMLFLPGDSCIAAKLANNDIALFEVTEEGIDSKQEYMHSLFPIIHWHSIPNFLDQRNRFKMLGRWSRGNLGQTFVWIPGYLDVDSVLLGSSTIALVCKDGRVIFLLSTDKDINADGSRYNIISGTSLATQIRSMPILFGDYNRITSNHVIFISGNHSDSNDGNSEHEENRGRVMIIVNTLCSALSACIKCI